MKKLKPHTIDWTQIDRFLAGADKKLASALFSYKSATNDFCLPRRESECSMTQSVLRFEIHNRFIIKRLTP